MPRLSPIAGCWAFLAALAYLAAFVVSTIVESLTVIITLMLSGMFCVLMTIIAQRHGHRPELAAHPAPATTPMTRSAGGTHRRPTARHQPVKRPVAGSRKRPQCSTRCRRSTQPRADCDCSCGGVAHGSEAGRVRRKAPRKRAPARRPGQPGGNDTQVGDAWGPWRRTR